jgi:histidinol-phosphate/aromatic aminotransferase/cobyric acid decarboxylase-like protein
LGVLASGDEDLVAEISKDLSIWNINSFAEFYLQICEKYIKDFETAMERFYPVREELYEQLRQIQFLEPIHSKANFMTCRITNGSSARDVAMSILKQQNILIKDLTGKPGITGECIRVAVKTPEENARLVEAFRCML